MSWSINMHHYTIPVFKCQYINVQLGRLRDHIYFVYTHYRTSEQNRVQ